jgi:hypothetical protein
LRFYLPFRPMSAMGAGRRPPDETGSCVSIPTYSGSTGCVACRKLNVCFLRVEDPTVFTYRKRKVGLPRLFAHQKMLSIVFAVHS